jgi:hypothetical protein
MVGSIYTMEQIKITGLGLILIVLVVKLLGGYYYKILAIG